MLATAISRAALFQCPRDSAPGCVMRPPNNQSLTRLAATLTARSRRHRRHPNGPTNTNQRALTSTPFTASCETVACRLRINLVKLPARPGVVLARSRIDKLPGPVFRRHVTRSTSRPRKVGNVRGMPVTKMRRGKSN